jgi:endoglucanase
MTANNLPIWNGEFGPVYEMEGAEMDVLNNERYQMLRDQLNLYKTKNIVGWSIWTLKVRLFNSQVANRRTLGSRV